MTWEWGFPNAAMPGRGKKKALGFLSLKMISFGGHWNLGKF